MALPVHIPVWVGTAAKTYYFRERGNVKTGPVAGIVSCWKLDVDVYDTDWYRDDETFTGPLVAGTGDPALKNAKNYVTLGTPDAVTPIQDTISSVIDTVGPPAVTNSGVYSLSDETLKIPPRPQLKKRTLLEFWDNAAGNGNVLYEVWADQHISASLADYDFI